MDTLISLMESLGYAIDTPGAYTRGLLAGRPGERASGRDMLQSWGIQNPGFLGGLGAEMLFDPMNLIPAGMLAKGARSVSGINRANKASRAMRAGGAAPGELADVVNEVARAVDSSGNPTSGWRMIEDIGSSDELAGMGMAKERAYTLGGDYPLYLADRADPRLTQRVGELAGEATGINPHYYRPSYVNDRFEMAGGPVHNNQSVIDDLRAGFVPGYQSEDAIARLLNQFGYDSMIDYDMNYLPLANTGKMYLPYFAPELQKTNAARSLGRPAAAMIGYNASMLPFRDNERLLP